MGTFRQISIFLQLAKTLHFGRTAQQLGISQAALSKEISQLENSIGFRLFNRSNKWNVTLTEAGKVYFQQLKNLPNTLTQARERARRTAAGEAGTLTIAVANMVYDYLHLGDLLRQLHDMYPDIRLFIRDHQGSPPVIEQIKNGQVDIGFLAVNNLGNPIPGLSQRKMLSLPLYLAIPSDHPLARRSNLLIEDFRNCQFILPPAEQAPWLRNYFETFFIQHCGQLPLVAQEAMGLRATRQLVSAGLGVGVVVKPPESDERENIVYCSMPFDLQRIIVAAWDENNQSQALKNILALLNRSSCKAPLG